MEELATLVMAAFNADFPVNVTDAVVRSAVTRLGTSVEGPTSRFSDDDGTFRMELIVASPSSNAAFSISPRNLLGLAPVTPRFLNDALKAGVAGVSAATIANAGAFAAFSIAVMVLAVRTVGRDEAMILHMAHRIARADGTFTLDDMLAVAPELQSEYDVVKVGKDDLRAHLENLERANSLSPVHNGFRLSERILLIRMG